jgi:hypothetical protein
VTITATTADSDSEHSVLPKLYANSICIASVHFFEAEYPTNPTPMGCVPGN